MNVRPDRIISPHWNALPEETRANIGAAVPAGLWITLTAGHRGKPGTADVRLRSEDGEVIAETRGRDLAGMCGFVLSTAPVLVPGEQYALRVTVNAGGYVTDISEGVA